MVFFKFNKLQLIVQNWDDYFHLACLRSSVTQNKQFHNVHDILYYWLITISTINKYIK